MGAVVLVGCVHCAQYFVNTSLAPVVLFRRRLKSVADVLQGIRDKGFTSSRWNALLSCWEAVCRHCSCGRIYLFSRALGWVYLVSTGGFFDC